MNQYSLFNRDGSFSHVVSGNFRLVIAPTLTLWDGYHYEGVYDETYLFRDGEPQKINDQAAE